MPRPLGFISVNDPEAAKLAILPGNGTLEELRRLFPGTDPDRYNAIAAGNAAGLARAKQLIPGVDNNVLIFGGLALLAAALLMGGRRR